MRCLQLLFLLFAVFCATLAKEGDIHCHSKNTQDGKTCNFINIWPEMLRYCHQYDEPRLTGVDRRVPYNYVKFLAGDACYPRWFGPCVKRKAIFHGHIHFDTNWGNWGLPHEQWNVLSYQRCMEYMGTIANRCHGQGGTYDTGFGQINAMCIQA